MPLFQDFLYDDAGDPVVGADVDLFDRNDTSTSRATDTTDANGGYSISHVTEGRFDIQITSGSSVRRTKYDRATQMEELDVGVLRLRDSTDDSHTLTLTTGNLTVNSTLDLSTVTSQTKWYVVQPFAATTPVDVGDGAAYFPIIPDIDGYNLTDVGAKVVTAGVTGTLTIQVRNVTQNADMLTTKLTIDTGETGSDTAATPAVIDAANDDVADFDLLRIDIDVTQTTRPQGLFVMLGFSPA